MLNLNVILVHELQIVTKISLHKVDMGCQFQKVLKMDRRRPLIILQPKARGEGRGGFIRKAPLTLIPLLSFTK